MEIMKENNCLQADGTPMADMSTRVFFLKCNHNSIWRKFLQRICHQYLFSLWICGSNLAYKVLNKPNPVDLVLFLWYGLHKNVSFVINPLNIT